METLIRQIYEFNKYSEIYGQFLQEIYNSCNNVEISDASRYYQVVRKNSLMLKICVPESVAVILKLKFGAYLCNDSIENNPETTIRKYELNNLFSYYNVDKLYQDLKTISLNFGK